MPEAGDTACGPNGPFGLRLPVLLLVAVLIAAGAVNLYFTREMTFYQDTWAFLMERRDLSVDAVFLPHSEHIVVIPVLLEQLLVRVFGMSSARPEYVLYALALLGSAALLFVYLRRRVGDWLALIAVTLVLFLGPAWEVLLWPFEVFFVGSVFFGLAALLALEREDRPGDVAACIFLTLCLGCSSLGIPFLVGCAVAFALGPRERRLRRAYAVAVPALLIAAWYLIWGQEGASHVSVANALDSPKWMLEAVVANTGSALGLNPDPTSDALGRGPNPEPGLNPVWSWLIVGAIALATAGWVAVRRSRGIRVSRCVWPVAAIACSNWFLTALNYFHGREATNSRYQYAGAIFVLMLVASLFDGVRPRRLTVAVGAVVAALAVVPHIVVLGKGADFLDEQSVLTRADTGAMEIARNTIDPGFQLSPEVAGTTTLINVTAGEYFAATDEYGSPAYTPAELAAAPERGRFQADVVLVHALGVGLSTEAGGFGRGGAGCTTLPAGEKPEVALRRGTTTRIEVAPGPEASFRLRRFASGEYPVRTGLVPGDSASELTIPADTVSRPWQLLVEADQRVRVCR